MKKLGATLVVPIRGDLKHLMRKAQKMIKATVTGQEHIPIEVANLATFLFYRYKFVFQAKDKNKNIFLLPIRRISNRYFVVFSLS